MIYLFVIFQELNKQISVAVLALQFIYLFFFYFGNCECNRYLTNMYSNLHNTEDIFIFKDYIYIKITCFILRVVGSDKKFAWDSRWFGNFDDE